MESFKIGHELPPLNRQRTRELHAKNSWATRSAPEQMFKTVKLRLDSEESLRYGHAVVRRSAREVDWSHSTTFARGGIQTPQGLYRRDPTSGSWFKDTLAKDRNVMNMPLKPSPKN